jgi:metal-responsive CopG/Arc/MetJ family transcriptional regulator
MMAAKTVGIAVADDLRPALDEVVEHFGHGNRSEFLRLAVRDYQGRLRLERLHALRDEARAERGGRVYSTDEVLDLIRETAAS